MVCYARPAGCLAAILVVAALVVCRPVGHFFGTAALLAGVTVATAAAAAAAALAAAAFVSVRRRRAVAGGCVSCRFRCQHAMTERAGRLTLVTIADRAPAGPAAACLADARAGPRAGRPAGPPAADQDPPAPRWPDRPWHHTARPAAAPVPRRRRAAP